MANAFELIAAQIDDPNAQWSLGTFGAIAEFMRDAGEPAEIARGERRSSVVTPRGGIRHRGAPGSAAGGVRDDHHQAGASASRSACPRREAR